MKRVIGKRAARRLRPYHTTRHEGLHQAVREVEVMRVEAVPTTSATLCQHPVGFLGLRYHHTSPTSRSAVSMALWS